MKKKKWLLLILGILIICGCTPKNGTLTCTNRMNKNGIVLNTDYTVKYKNNYVTMVKTVEVIEAKKEVLLEYQEALKSSYEPYNELDGYQNEIVIKKGTLISTTMIDYSKIDTKKLISLDQNNKTVVKDGKVKLEDMKKIYQEMGAICKIKKA